MIEPDEEIFLGLVPRFIRENVRKGVKQITDIDRNYLFVMSTGSGKTFISAWFTLRHVHNNNRVLYAVPLRSIAFSHAKLLRDFFGIPAYAVVGRDPWHWVTPSYERDIINTAPVVITTYHKAYRIAGRNLFDAVVLDEIHTVRENRYVDFLLARLSGIPTVALSATITRSDAENIASTLDMKNVYFGNVRPVKIEFIATKPESKIKIYDTEITANLYSLLSTLNGKIIVFVSSRQKAESMSLEFNKMGIKSIDLHAGYSEREILEREKAYAEDDSIKVLFATTVVGMGVSLPADHVIITIDYFTDYIPILDYEGHVIDVKRRRKRISRSEIIQLAGRCGRFSSKDKHYAIYLGNHPEYLSSGGGLPPPTPIDTEVVSQHWVHELILAGDYMHTISYALHGDELDAITEKKINFLVKNGLYDRTFGVSPLGREVNLAGLRVETVLAIKNLDRDSHLDSLIHFIVFANEYKQYTANRILPIRAKKLLIAWIKGLPVKINPNQVNDFSRVVDFSSHMAYSIYRITGKWFPLWVMIASGLPFKHAWKGFIGVKRSKVYAFDDLMKQINGKYNGNNPDVLNYFELIDAYNRNSDIFMTDVATVVNNFLYFVNNIYNTNLWQRLDFL